MANNGSKPDPRTWKPTEEMLDQIESWSKMGMTEASIARNLGLHPSTFSEKKHLWPELDERIKRGHAVGEDFAIQALWNMIKDPKSKGHVTGTVFYLKCKHNWNDGTRNAPVEATAPDGVKFEIIDKSKVKNGQEEN